MLTRRQSAEQVKTNGQSISRLEANITVHGCNESVKKSPEACGMSGFSLDEFITSSNLKQGDDVPGTVEGCQGSSTEATCSKTQCLGSNSAKPVPYVESKKKARQGQWSQLSLRSFFQKSSSDGISSSGMNVSLNQGDVSNSDHSYNKSSTNNDESNTRKNLEPEISVSIQDHYELDASHSTVKEKRIVALAEWQRIQEVMQNSIPICKSHNEPCVARIVRKSGPNMGRRFFVCARAEVCCICIYIFSSCNFMVT